MSDGRDGATGGPTRPMGLHVEPTAVQPLQSSALGLGDVTAQPLFGFVRRLGLSDEQADDAVQEVLTRLLEQAQAGTVVVNPRAWAFRAIYRIAMDHHRLRRRLAAIGELLWHRQQGEPDVDVTDRTAVWSEVDALPERQRAVIYLRYRADLRFEEIAETLGITTSAARSHAAQATATLRARLADRLGDHR